MCDLCSAHCVICVVCVVHIVVRVRTLCYKCDLCDAHCVICAICVVNIVLHVQFVRVTCVTSAHIVLHVGTVRCTLYYVWCTFSYVCTHCATCAVCEGHIVLHVRFYASHVLYHNERFGIVKI